MKAKILALLIACSLVESMVAPLFAQLSQKFEQCVYGLNLVKNELEVMQHPIARRTSELIM